MMPCAFILEAISGFFTALFGAAFGAYAAYFLAKRQQEEKRRVESHGHAIAAFYVLVARFSALENFARKYLDEKREGIPDELAMSLVYQHCPREVISIRSLAFMGDSQDSELLHELSVSEARYFNFVDALEERNRDLRTVIDAAHSEGLRAGEPFTPAFANRPEVDLVVCQNRNLVAATSSALNSVSEQINKLHVSVKRRFEGLPAPYVATPKLEEANKVRQDNRP